MLFAAFAHAELPDGTAPPPASTPEAALEAGAASLDVAVRAQAIGALVRMDAAPCTSAWTLRGMADPSPYVQRTTLASLERAADGCVTQRAEWAASPRLDAHTRAIAASRLGPEAQANITEWAMALRSDGRSAYFLLLAARGGSKEAGTRLDALARSGNLPLEREFYVALGADAETYTFPFTDALAAAEPEAQPWIAAAWFDHAPKEGKAAVRALLHDRDEDRVFDTIEAVLDNPDAAVLLRGVSGVDARLATTMAPALAARHLDGLTMDRQLDAIRTLGRSADPRHRALLRARYPIEEDDTVRVALARALASGATAEDTPLLIAMLGDALLDIRVAAAAALRAP